MRISVRSLTVGVLCAFVLLLAEPRAWSADTVYLQTNLVSDIPGFAQSTDPNLKNPWGNSFSATSPFWVANAGSNTSTLYQGTGSTVNARVVAVGGGPTGTVQNPTTDFVQGNGRAAGFLFSTLSGSIYAWNATNTNNIAERLATVPNASFTGLALANNGSANFLYATNVAGSGSIAVFDATYALVSLPAAFVDPNVPAGMVPFNVQNINGQLYVEYTNLSTGAGAVAVFDANGVLIKDLIPAGEPHLNAPWGVVRAPANFGTFSGALLVGNFGDGKINAYDATSGAFLGTLTDFNGPIVNSGLWSLTVRTGGTFDTTAVYITAGTNIQGSINGPSNGLLAKINAVTPATVGIMTASQLPSGNTGSAYTQALAPTGGVSPYSNWRILNGSLPPGMLLNPTTGVLSGTPNTVGGTFSFTIGFVDTAGTAGAGSFQLVIQPPSASAPTEVGSFSQIAAGGGWRTAITLVNMSANSVDAQINFHRNDGTPVTLSLAFPQSNSKAMASTLPVTVGPNSSVVIQTDSSGSSISEGWADVLATDTLSGYSTFAYNVAGLPELSATAPLDSRLLSSLTLPFDSTQGYQTAVALANQSSTEQSVTLTVLDQNGASLDTTQISLPPYGHSAFFLSSKVALAANQLGILQFQSGAGVTGMSLRFGPTGSFTSIPIIR
jgi:uncharacterized protein (TIGR03118 family)